MRRSRTPARPRRLPGPVSQASAATTGTTGAARPPLTVPEGAAPAPPAGAGVSSTPAIRLPPLTTVTHDLRGPLQALALSTEMLLDSAGGSEAARGAGKTDPSGAPDFQVIGRLAATIQRQVVWLQGLVENLHATTSLQAGHFAIHPYPVDLREIVTNMQTVVAPLLAHKSQSLRLHLPAGARVLPLVAADGRRIGQALLNLLLNASKYSPAGTPITLSVRAGRDHVRVVVADRGAGLPPGNPTRLFAPFTRAALARRSGQEGMGLGLAIVHEIVAAHGGGVGAARRRGGGACFWFELPAQPPCAGAPAQPARDDLDPLRGHAGEV